MNDLGSEAAALKRWLFDVALPLWWEDGADHSRGGFHEAIDLDGRPVAQPHRARVLARQAFSYCEAGRLGWNGPWREASHHALEYFRRHFVTADATVVSLVDLDGRAVESNFDLYDQAFALLAYASGHRVFGRPAAGVDKQWRCAGRSRNAMAIHSAAFSRIAAADYRSARTRTCTCSNQRSRGSPSTTIRPGAAWATPSPHS